MPRDQGFMKLPPGRSNARPGSALFQSTVSILASSGIVYHDLVYVQPRLKCWPAITHSRPLQLFDHSFQLISFIQLLYASLRLLVQSTTRVHGWDATHHRIGISPNLFSCLNNMRCDSAKTLYWYQATSQGIFVMR